MGNSPVTSEFLAQMASKAENVSIWWHHHVSLINSPQKYYHSISVYSTCYDVFVSRLCIPDKITMVQKILQHCSVTYGRESNPYMYTLYTIHTTLKLTLIARFMEPTWGPSGANRTQVGLMLAPWTLLSGYILLWHFLQSGSGMLLQNKISHLWKSCEMQILWNLVDP